MPERIPACHILGSVDTFCLELPQMTRSPSLQAMAHCQRLLAEGTENKIVGFYDNTNGTTSRKLSPKPLPLQTVHLPQGAMALVLSLSLLNVSLDDVAVSTVRRHHIDLCSRHGSSSQFLSLFPQLSNGDSNLSSTEHCPAPGTLFGNNLTTQSSSSCNMIVSKETTWRPRTTKEHSLGPARWWQPPFLSLPTQTSSQPQPRNRQPAVPNDTPPIFWTE